MLVDSIDWGTAPAWGLIAVSFLFSLIAFFNSRKGLQYQKQAAEAAIRSAEAAERSLHWARQESESSADTTAPSGTTPDVAWALERPGGKARFVLRNTGTETATGVSVSGTDLGHVGIGLPEQAVVAPGASVTFMMAGSLAHRVPDEVWVSWDGDPGSTALPVPE